MKTIILIITLTLLFSSSTCKKEGSDCHRAIIIKNNSAASILPAFKISDIYGQCRLSGSIIETDSSYEDSRNTCWENWLFNGKTYELYIIDPANYNVPLVFYDCDSITFKNTVLKHFILTLDELKQSNFTITYP